MLALVAIIFASFTLAQVPPPLCSTFNQTTNLCPISYGGFHVLCAPLTPNQAVSACANLNMRLALLTDANVLQALYTLQECSIGADAGWVAAWNGAGADPCAVVSVEGAVKLSLGFEGCSALKVAVCQDLPTTTAVYTNYNVDIVTTGTSTSVVSICTLCDKYPLPPQQYNKNNNEKDNIVEKRRPHRRECDRSHPESCRHPHPPTCPFGPCTPVCPFTVCGLHVVQAANLTYADAQEECAKYGWNLADLSSAQHEDVAFLQGYCSRQSAENAFWIRSFNGVDGAKCVKALAADEDGNVPIGFGVEDGWCSSQDRPWALCQDAAPAVTGTGFYNGPVSFVASVTISLGTTLTTPVSTTTTTVTNYFTTGCGL